MLGLGQQLRSAREAQGLTLGEASAKIHIRAEYLGALEEEQWSMFADPIYVRGFLRTYAHFLELRAEAVVAQYNEIAPVGMKLLGPDLEEAPKKKGTGRMSLVFALLILFGGMGFAGYAFLTHAGSLAFALPNNENMLPIAAVTDATPEVKPTPLMTVAPPKSTPAPRQTNGPAVVPATNVPRLAATFIPTPRPSIAAVRTAGAPAPPQPTVTVIPLTGVAAPATASPAPQHAALPPSPAPSGVSQARSKPTAPAAMPTGVVPSAGMKEAAPLATGTPAR